MNVPYCFDPPSALDVTPAHIEVQGALRRPGEWFPCEHPERPFEVDLTVLHDCCSACLIAARAAVMRGHRLWWASDDEPLLAVMERRLADYGPAPRLGATS